MNQPSSSPHARRLPGSTYRLQFHAGFTLRDATVLVPYLHALGVTHLYASPILKARPGSTHGYDIIDHGALNPEIGSDADLAALVSLLREHRMGLILDVVPNHMSVGTANSWWADVLEHGPSSPFADYFDIAWFDSPRVEMHGRLLLPVLGDQYGVILESGQLAPVFEGGRFFIGYQGTLWPIDPRTYGHILGPAAEALRHALGAAHPSAIELTSILHSVQHLPLRLEPDRKRLAAGHIECAALRRRLAELPDRFPEAVAAVNEALLFLAGKPGEPGTFAPLDALLEAQAYRLCFWRVASDEINYRRFFDINDLAALSTEREDVFLAVHKTWLTWAARGIADGLRIDHPDGLFDPKQYLERLQEHYRALVPDRVEPFYVVVEKILGDGEALPADWACEGTTGYEFINAVNGLFIDPRGEGPLSQFYQRFTERSESWPEVVYRSKRQVSQESLASELNALAYQLDRIARLDRRSRDFTLNGIRKALREVVACCPVYRSYVDRAAHDADKAVVGKSTSRAYRRNPLLGKAIFDFIRDTVLLKDSPSGPPTEEYRALQRAFAGKFQQVTSPVAAKGVEDTAFYVYHRFVSLNEVGGEPGRFGWKPSALHAFFAARIATPGGLAPLSTHDTKRGEDVRARINVLSELPSEWTERVTHWAELNRRHKTEVEGALAPDANEEYLLYQTLVGAWPGTADAEFTTRIQQYMKKALAEAKVHTSWINPDAEYESAVELFIARLLDPAASNDFLADLGAFASRVAFFGRINSLAQTLIRCTAPGVPDTYQGTEVWDLSLVDPDNRRPVDYAIRLRWLKELDSARDRHELARALAANPADPRMKLFVAAIALRARGDHSDLFSGGYVPLDATGDRAEHSFAFLRTAGSRTALVVVPRLPVGLVPEGDRLPVGDAVWGETALELPPEFAGQWRNVLTGEDVESPGGRLALGRVLGAFPVALLVPTSGDD